MKKYQYGRARRSSRSCGALPQCAGNGVNDIRFGVRTAPAAEIPGPARKSPILTQFLRKLHSCKPVNRYKIKMIMECGMSTLLVVDDDSEMLEAASMMLEFAGYDVLTAGSGYAALKLCEEHSEIDLVLTDIDMPEMNGMELADRLSGLTRHVAIVLMTAHPVETPHARATRSSREYRILRKPFGAAELREQMAYALGVPAPAG